MTTSMIPSPPNDHGDGTRVNSPPSDAGRASSSSLRDGAAPDAVACLDSIERTVGQLRASLRAGGRDASAGRVEPRPGTPKVGEPVARGGAAPS